MSSLVLLLSIELTSHACAGDTTRTVGKKIVANDATHCASKSGIIGAHCSYATSVMARRVLEQGSKVTRTATLESRDADPPGGISAPYRFDDDEDSRVIANELVEHLVTAKRIGVPVEVEARKLEFDGSTYYVLVAYEPPNS